MFTGIIETLGTIQDIRHENGLIHFSVASNLGPELKVDQSVAHDGVCLTVTEISLNTHTVTAVQETLDKTNLKEWGVGRKVNLERCMLANGRFDGHIVQGHVDAVGKIETIKRNEGNIEITFLFPSEFKNLIVEKGSICINGTSLTAYNVTESRVSVTIIPYTWDHTSMHEASEGSSVNLEFDILGKYISKLHTGR